jgi:bacteriorhodopsin
VLRDIRPPWAATLTQSEHSLIFYFLLLAGLALFVGFIRAWITRTEVSARYRTAVVARLGIMSVAALSYVVLLFEFGRGYALKGGVYVPNANALLSFAPRYVEWSVSVPLLVVELIAVCAVTGTVARRTRSVAATATFLMIFAGFLGAVVLGNGENQANLVLWGGISCFFWIFANVVLIRVVRQSLPKLTEESSSLLKAAATLLLVGWVIYPVVFLIQIFAFGGGWTTTIQVALSIADIVVKLGFSGLIHRIAKLRTAEDVRAGEDVHPESIWISSVKQSDAGLPREVYLADGAAIHQRRQMPPSTVAVPSAAIPIEEEVLEHDELLDDDELLHDPVR